MQESNANKNTSFRKWKEHSAALRSSLMVPASAKPWTRQSGVELNGVVKQTRCLDVLDCAFLAHRHANPGKSTKELTENLYCDFTQSVARKPWFTKPGTLLTATKVYIRWKTMAAVYFRVSLGFFSV